MLVCMAGVNHVREVGQEVDLDNSEAKRLIEAGYAEPVKQQREKATASRMERAVKQ